MNDLISRQAAIDVFGKLSQGKYYTKLINSIPSADVVEVVRCKDCEHFEAINNDDHGWCKMISDLPCGISVRYDNDYCSYGERSDE